MKNKVELFEKETGCKAFEWLDNVPIATDEYVKWLEKKVDELIQMNYELSTSLFWGTNQTKKEQTPFEIVESHQINRRGL